VFSPSYPAILRRDKPHGYYLSFPDVPGANTGDEDRDSTLAGAADCLTVALETYIEQGRDVPLPSKPKTGQYVIAIPRALALRLAVYQALRDARADNAKLIRHLDAKSAQRVLARHLEQTLTRLETAEAPTADAPRRPAVAAH
jgi:antitoxin HicB